MDIVTAYVFHQQSICSASCITEQRLFYEMEWQFAKKEKLLIDKYIFLCYKDYSQWSDESFLSFFFFFLVFSYASKQMSDVWLKTIMEILALDIKTWIIMVKGRLGVQPQ